MSALLMADLAALEGAHRKLEGAIGTQRLRAAEKAFAAKLSPAAVGPASNASETISPSLAAEQPPAASAPDQVSVDETLALARAAGVGRFTAAQEMAPTKPAGDECDALALARAAGVGRYKS